MTFYLKYRPQTIDDLDITSVRESLSNVVASGNIPHAFLFSGPKGTGKTSTARILAKIINCEAKKVPCNKCDSCLSITNGTNIDVIEMDAASNRGIDDVRALRDVVKLSPAKSKAKIYIIDEAHMLTTEASNALLKTLEEPPAHVYFVLATTNPEKLIDTIRSRTTNIVFSKATFEETKRSLKRIIDSEKIEINDDSIAKIIKISKGSFRDAVKLLEQYTNDKNFLLEQQEFDANEFVEKILNRKLDELLTNISCLVDKGVSVANITLEILEVLQLKLLETKSSEIINLIELILDSQQYNKVTPIEELPLQLALIKWCDLKTDDNENNDKQNHSEGNNDATKPDKKEEIKLDKNLVKDVKKKVKKEELNNDTSIIEAKVTDSDNQLVAELDINYWNKMLLEIKPINSTIEGLLRCTKPLSFDGKSLKVGVGYRFHKDKLEETKNRKMLEDVAEKIFQNQIRIEWILTDSLQKIETSQLTKQPTENIMNVAEAMFS